MKVLIKTFFLISLFVNTGLISVAQTPAITKVAKFKPPVVKSYLGINTNGDSITKEEASQLISVPLKVTDDKKNVYTVTSYRFLYKRKSVVEDEETGKKSISFTTVSDRFRTSPLPDLWVNNIKNGFQTDEQLFFFDIIVKDDKNREFFAPDLKLTVL